MTDEEIIKMYKEKQMQVQLLNKEIEELKRLYFEKKSNIKLEMSDEEKINIFANYFRGRDDVYPQ